MFSWGVNYDYRGENFLSRMVKEGPYWVVWKCVKPPKDHPKRWYPYSTYRSCTELYLPGWQPRISHTKRTPIKAGYVRGYHAYTKKPVDQHDWLSWVEYHELCVLRCLILPRDLITTAWQSADYMVGGEIVVARNVWIPKYSVTLEKESKHGKVLR